MFYCLLKGKTVQHYIHVFAFLRSKMPSEPLQRRLHKKVKEVWPTNITHKTVASISHRPGTERYRGLAHSQLPVSRVRRHRFIFAHFLWSPFPATKWSGRILGKRFPSIRTWQHKVKQFCDYVFKTYVEDGAKFPPTIWASFSCSVTRTTNAWVVSYKTLNRMFHISIMFVRDAIHTGLIFTLEAIKEMHSFFKEIFFYLINYKFELTESSFH